MHHRSIPQTLRQLIARDVAKTRATPVGEGPSDLSGRETLNSPAVDVERVSTGNMLGPRR